VQILISIDDTDNIDSRGTGELASLIAEELEANGWGRCGFVTRHQLFVHPDIRYTSHNSAMCFNVELNEDSIIHVINHAAAFLARESAEGSDPGLCVAVLDRLTDPESLISFGRQAKSELLTKARAYAVARNLGVYLSEHGGSGDGVIGALAGAGLRLSGNDGRLKGQIRFAPNEEILSVARLCSRTEIDTVRTLDGITLAGSELVQLGNKVKTVLLEGKSVLLVSSAGPGAAGAPWRTCSQQQLRGY
jgi:hypothetical protein